MSARKNNSCHSEASPQHTCRSKASPMQSCHSEARPKHSCHSEPGVKPGEEPADAARLVGFLIGISLLSFSPPLSAQAPQDFLATGHVDQALQTLKQQIRTAPNAEIYNLLCRAHFELGAWDAGISACEKATALEPNKGLYHLWLGRTYGEKADHAGFLSAAGLAGKVRTEFERAVQLSPSSWEARTDLAEFYLEAPGMVGGGKDKAL